LRILFVTQIVPFPPHGGVLQRGYNLLRELGKRNEVHLLAFHHPDELRDESAVAESRRALGEFCKSVEYFELWPKRSKIHTAMALGMSLIYPKPFSVLAQMNLSLKKRIAQLCSTDSIDVVHLDTIALAPLKTACGSLPVVLAHHNIESQLMLRRAEHETNWATQAYVRLQARRLRRYESQQCAGFAVNITVSEADSLALKAIAPGTRTAVVPNGVDTDYFSPRRGEESPALIYTGGMNMFANRDAVDWFLDAVWPRIKAAVPEVQFFAIGQRPSAQLLDAAARDEAIKAPGFVDDVRPWVARSSVYVVPLRVGGGTRLKMVDAMAQGKAIVSTTLGAEGIEGSDGQHFVLADTPADFADSVVKLLRDPALRIRLGDEARRRAESHYGWPRLGERQVDAYTEAIARTNR
jgi:polysaccharide biosynthesis protein PslH